MKRMITICIASIMTLGLISANVDAAKTETQKLIASDGAAEDYACSVSISGDHAIMGARGDDDNGSNSGSAYVFERIGGIWTEVAKLIASDAAAEDQFGRGVSIFGDYAIVGAPSDDDNGSNSGSAYVYKRIGGVWTEVAKLTASDGVDPEMFGYSVSISSDCAIVGAPNDDDNSFRSGSAYVFECTGGGWTKMAKLTDCDGTLYDHFGHSVSTSGDHVIVGAPGDDEKGYNKAGAAHIFERSNLGWTKVAKLTAIDGAAEDQFGRTVSISDNHAIVGAFGNDDHSFRSGSAYAFERIGGIWTQVAKLTASDGAYNDMFGYSVSVSGDCAIVGAHHADSYYWPYYAGAAYVYERIGGVWTEVAKLRASDGDFGDGLGYSASVSGDCAIVLAYADDDNGNLSGSAYIYELAFDQVPVANAGGPYVKSARSWDGAMVVLNGLDSYDPDGGIFYFEWDLDLAIDSDDDGNPANDADETTPTALWMFPIGQIDIALTVRDAAGLASPPDVTSVTVSYINVGVDIKPGEYPNTVNMGSHGIIQVAFLTDEIFDASTIDPLTVTLRGEDFSDGLVKLRGKKEVPLTTLEDVDGDGDLDLLVKLDAEKLSEYEIDALCVLGALTYDGYVVSGSDTIRVVPVE